MGYAVIWQAKVNDRTVEFATNTQDFEKSFQALKTMWETKHPDKAFNLDSLTYIHSYDFWEVV